MSITKSTVGGLTVAVITVFLAACGKGGTSKSSDAQNPSDKPTKPVAESRELMSFTSDNYVDVAAQSLKTLLLNDAGTTALEQVVGMTVAQNQTTFQDQVTGAVFKLLPYNCSLGGSFTTQAIVNGTEQNIQIDLNKNLSVVMDTTFNKCNQVGSTVDGKVHMDFVTNFGKLIAATAYGLDFNLDVANLTVTQPNIAPFSFNGSFGYNITSTQTAQKMVIKSDGVSHIADKEYQTLSVDLTRVVQTTGEYSYTIKSKLISHLNPKEFFSYETVAPLVGKGFGAPNGGELIISGKEGTIYVKALANQSLNIQLDRGSDGSIDDTYSSTWEDLVMKSLNVAK
jgi:hypothetical protein